MDVTCERCGTEYEFDETLLSGRGTSVKCTNCGHVFKVYPRAQAEADRATSSWRLRLADGSIDMIDSLRELQRRIGSNELTPANEISRGDEEWKTLGSIPELDTFFQAAGVPVPPQEVREPSLPSSVPPAASSKDSSLPPGRRPRQPTLLGVMPVDRAVTAEVTGSGTGSAPEPTAEAVAESALGPASAPTPVVASVAGPTEGVASYESPYVSDSVTAPLPSAASEDVIEDAVFEERPHTASRSSVRTSTPPPAYYEDDDDIPDLPGRGWSPLRWLVVIVAVGGLALMGTQWERVAGLLGIGSNPVLIAAGVTEGDAALAQGDPQAYASAIDAYGRSIEAGGDRDSEIMARLSRAYALAAQAQIDSNAAGDSVGSLSAAALATAQTAVALDPRDFEAKLAVSDALRLAEEHADARTVLEEARSMSFSRTAEFFRVDSRLSAAEAGGMLENGLRSAKQAVQLSPRGVPYLLLLARAQRAANDPADARAALDTILADHPGHTVATQLLAELDATDVALAPDAGVEEDAGVAADGGAVAETAEEPETVAVPATAAAEEPETVAPSKDKVERKAPPKRRRAPKKPAYDEYDQLVKAAGDDAFVDGRPPVRDYEWYMRQGRAELAGGNYSRARAFFDSALEARPGSADAMDGLGHMSTRIEDFNSALRYFRVAAQRGHPDGYFNLGRTYESLGQKEEAVSAYYTYVKRRPSGRHAATARAVIKILEPNAKLPPEPEAEPAPEPTSEPAEEPAAEPEPQSEPEAKADPPPAEEPAQAPEPATP
jgi:predicted Zn finger-like uncharacterized protein